MSTSVNSNNKFKTRLLAVGFVAMFITTIGLTLFNFTKPTESATTPGTCLPVSKGGTGVCSEEDLLSKTYPVGSIYVSVNSSNPSTYLGGVWEEFGGGRTLVGVDTAQAEFDTVGESGGSKTHVLTVAQLPNYSIGSLAVAVPPMHTNWNNEGIGGISFGATSGQKPGIAAPSSMTITSGTQYGFNINSRGSNGPHNNLQPYVTVYFWKRVS